MKNFNSEANRLLSFVKLNIENHMSTSKKILICSILAFPLIANSATVSNQKNAVADVVFTQPNNYTHTLTSVAALNSGTFTEATKIADGKVKSEGNLSEYYALQFASTTSHNAGTAAIEVKGKTNTNNKITVSLFKDVAEKGSFTEQTINGSKWLAYSDRVNILNYDVKMKPDSIVVADTYPITVTAAVYTS